MMDGSPKRNLLADLCLVPKHAIYTKLNNYGPPIHVLLYTLCNSLLFFFQFPKQKKDKKNLTPYCNNKQSLLVGLRLFSSLLRNKTRNSSRIKMVLYGKKKEHVFLNNLPNFRDLSYYSSTMEPIFFLLTEPKDMKSKKQKLVICRVFSFTIEIKL